MENLFDLDNASKNETKEFLYIKTSGIHEGLLYTGVSIETVESKKDNKLYTVAKFKFAAEDGRKLEHSYFRPPVSEAECTPYSKDEWKDGVKTGNKVQVTAKEVFQQRNQEYLYFLLQLQQGLGFTWDDGIQKLKGYTSSFETITNRFADQYKPDNKAMSKVDVKLLWNNDDKNKKSYLGIPKATEKSRVFGKHTEGKPTQLQISSYEQQGMTEKYPYIANRSNENLDGLETNADNSFVNAPNAGDNGGFASSTENLESMF